MLTSTTARHVHVEHVMGTAVSFDVRDVPDDPTAAIAAAVEDLRAVDRRFSTYRCESEIRRMRHEQLRAEDAHPDVRDVLDRCEELRAFSGGAFDHRPAAGLLDPSAYVKGWAVGRAATILQDAGLDRFCITGGGDVITRGGDWQVGIQHPLHRDAICAVVPAGDLAIATSGAYERGDHVRDHRTGRAPSAVLSVTVCGPDLGTADALSTAAFAMDADGPAWTAGLDGYEAMTILRDGTVLCTPAFPTQDDGGLQ
ncbi:FAD:protein FMN transferase [Patulibacter sp. NPDC049589]|uniref:FAD:protein FMN transferase n=1 Tax=Patulibacter sp. NPDC049589 TaxID=3154731 RepID=UPI00342F7C08